jgi:hypothetical protein
MEPPTIPRLRYSVPEAAAILGMSVSSVWRRARFGHIHLSRDGGRTFVSAEEIRRYAEQGLDRADV